MASEATPFLSPEDYLQIERAATFKSEYSQAQMYAMSGGTLNHSAIAVNESRLHMLALDSNVLSVRMRATGFTCFRNWNTCLNPRRFVTGSADQIRLPGRIHARINGPAKHSMAYRNGI